MAKTYTIKLYEETGFIDNLVIPEGFTDIGILTFCKARDKIKSVVFPSTMTALPEKLFKECSHLQSVDLGNSKIRIIPKDFCNGCEQLKQIILPSGITLIDDSAFEGCSSLESIRIPDGVIEIGSRVFLGCRTLQNMSLPDSLKIIGDYTFKYCDSFQSISLPIGLKNINRGVFYDCEKLQNVAIPQGLTEIGNLAFFNCFKLSIDTVPDSVTKIGKWAFGDCSSINSFTVPKGVKEIGEEAFGRCKSLQSISIPDSVTKIGEGAFLECESLPSITLPESVTKISEATFKRCVSLQNVIIPESVIEIGDYAFKKCESLKNISIPQSIIRIGEGAFMECKSLCGIMIPNSVTSIGEGAFENCFSLRSIQISDSVTEIGSRMLFGCNLDLYETESEHFKITGGLLIDKAKSKVLSPVFSYLTDIEIPDGVEVIGATAFQGCRSLQNILLPQSLTTIGDTAFCECEALRKISLPVGVSQVGGSAFYKCSSLECVTIDNPQIALLPWSFGNCKNLTTVNLPKGLSWTKIKDSFENSPWGMMSPKAALVAKKAAEEEAEKKALRIKQEKVRAMSAMASSFVIKQAFEVTFNSITSVISDNGNQWFDINLELSQGVKLLIRMPVVLKIEKVQDYTSILVEKISKIKRVLDDVFVDQNHEDNQIYISLSTFRENQSFNATINLNLNNSYTQAGNQIDLNFEEEDLEGFLSSIDELSEAVKNIDGSDDMRGKYKLIYNRNYYKICLTGVIYTFPKVTIPQFVSELCVHSFQGCNTLAEISIPRNIECSGWPFSDCSALRDVHLY